MVGSIQAAQAVRWETTEYPWKDIKCTLFGTEMNLNRQT